MKAPIAVITLVHPFDLPDKTVRELTMRRPTLRDEINYVPVSKDPRKQMEEEAAFFAHLCGMKLEELDLIDMEDYEKLQKQYLIFRGKQDDQGSQSDGGDSEPNGENAAP